MVVQRSSADETLKVMSINCCTCSEFGNLRWVSTSHIVLAVVCLKIHQWLDSSSVLHFGVLPAEQRANFPRFLSARWTGWHWTTQQQQHHHLQHHLRPTSTGYIFYIVFLGFYIFQPHQRYVVPITLVSHIAVGLLLHRLFSDTIAALPVLWSCLLAAVVVIFWLVLSPQSTILVTVPMAV